ncbi:MAG: toxin [Elusimicrobiota bacterium]
MADIQWDPEKSRYLKRTRGASFEDIIGSKLVAVKRHPKRLRRNIMLFQHEGYIWIVPYVKGPSGIFLKTLYPSRKYTRIHKRGAP